MVVKMERERKIRLDNWTEAVIISKLNRVIDKHKECIDEIEKFKREIEMGG